MATWRELLNEFVNTLSEADRLKNAKELHMVTWRELLKFTNTFDEADLEKEILISNPSSKLHYVSCVCSVQTKTGPFARGTKYIKAGPKPAARVSQLYTKWKMLLQFIGGLKEEELDQQAFIFSPKTELHIVSFCKKVISDDGWFAKGTIYLQVGKKKYKYWYSHFEEEKICVCRGFKEIKEYKFLELKPSKMLLRKEPSLWVLDKNWCKWVTSSGAYTAFQKQTIKLHLQEVTENAMQKIMSVEGTSKSFKKKSFEKKKKENEDCKYWYEHRGNRYGGKIHLYKGIKGIEEECCLDMSTGKWMMERNWTASKRGFPLPKDVIQISSVDADKFLSLIGTAELFSKIYRKYWYAHFLYQKSEEMYLCRGEKNIEEYIMMKRLLLKANKWVKMNTWSKWPIGLEKGFSPSVVEKRFVKITNHQAHKILSKCVSKTEATDTKKTVNKYWYIHIMNGNPWRKDTIYLYRGVEKIESYKQISVTTNTWKLWIGNWNVISNKTMPMPLDLLEEKLIEISEVEVERILSIVGKPDTFDCKTHVISYPFIKKRHTEETEQKQIEETVSEYEYSYWAQQSGGDDIVAISFRQICLCRTANNKHSYKVISISCGLSKWKSETKFWNYCNSNLGPQHILGLTSSPNKITKYQANQILNLVGKEKLYCCKKVINWKKGESRNHPKVVGKMK